jgi:hypothetical protein
LGVRKAVTVNLDAQLLEAVQHAAADDGVSQEQVLEEAIRRYFGLRGLALLDDMAEHQRSGGNRPDDDEALALALRELRTVRAEHRRARGA